MTPGRSATVTRIAADVSQKATGYMFGNLLTSLIAGTVVFVTLLILGVPFPLLWGLWVALVDFLPMIGGALLRHSPTVLFAFITQGLTAGIITAAVFAVYTQIENHVLNPVVMSKTVQATAPDQPLGNPPRLRLSQQTSVPTGCLTCSPRPGNCR